MVVAHAIGIDQLHWNIDLFGGCNYATSIVSYAAMTVEAGACEAALAFPLSTADRAIASVARTVRSRWVGAASSADLTVT